MKKSIILASIFVTFFAISTRAQTYTFNNDLGIGSAGQDVSNLQTWLISNSYGIPSINSGIATKGYFGSQTQAAVMAYQRSIGLPAYGFFGPLTRTYWRDHFGNGGNLGGNPGASLRVTSPNGGETWQKGTNQYITWTGVSGILNQAGDIKLEFAVPACALPTANPRCMIATQAPLTIATGVSLNSGSYAWKVGAFIPSAGCLSGYVCDPMPIVDGQYKIQICPTTVTSSSQCDDSDNYFNITSSSVPNGQSPVINGIDTQTSLAVNQSGTWTVHATDPLNGTLSYSVNWGDSMYPVAGYSASAASPQFSQSTSFTHSYSSAGTYTITFTIKNSSGQQTQTSSTVVVGSVSTVGSLKVTSPNGGEVWSKGTNQMITWTSPYYFTATTADLKLVPYQAPCTTQVCPMYMLAPYTIATGIQINQNSYSWNVGSVIPISASGYGIPTNVSSAPDGQYTIQICQGGTSNCDSSDSTFTITSNQTSNLPDINIISPNGGETLRAGTNQVVTVNVSGDSTKAGNQASAYLVNTNNQQTLIYSNYLLGGVPTGLKTFSVSIPSITSGNYKLLVNLMTTPMSTCYNCGIPAPTIQAYDYSDNYFTVTNY